MTRCAALTRAFSFSSVLGSRRLRRRGRWLELGVAAMRKGEVAVASRLFNEAIKRSDNRNLVVMQLEFSNAAGRYRATRQNANRFLAEHPKDIEVLFHGALADIRAGEGEDALKKAATLSELGASLKSGEIQTRVLGIRDDRAGVQKLLTELRDTDMSFVDATLADADLQTSRRKFEDAHKTLDQHIEALEAMTENMPLKDKSLSRLHLERAKVYHMTHRLMSACVSEPKRNKKLD